MGGWQGLAQVVSELVKPMTMSNSVKTQMLKPHRPQSRLDMGTFKDAVIQEKVDAVLAGFERDNYGKNEGISNRIGANHVEIDLKLILSVNPDGRWAAKWARPSNEVPGPKLEQTKTQVITSWLGEKGKNKMGLSNDSWAGPSVTKLVNKTWRPKANSKPTTDPLTNPEDPKPSSMRVQCRTTHEA
jgi:hypothetical protein